MAESLLRFSGSRQHAPLSLSLFCHLRLSFAALSSSPFRLIFTYWLEVSMGREGVARVNMGSERRRVRVN